MTKPICSRFIRPAIGGKWLRPLAFAVVATASLALAPGAVQAQTSTGIASFVASAISIAEDGGQSTLTLTLNGPAANGGVTIPYNITGTGITAEDLASHSTLTGTITIVQGQRTGIITLTAIANDDASEGNESLRVTLQPPGTSYNGVAFSAGDANTDVVVTITTRGICDRTALVRDRIVFQISGVSDCAAVTAQQLSGINALNLTGAIDRRLTSLQVGDFAGMNLGVLWLNSNLLTTLPVGVFSDLSNSLHTLSLGANRLTRLPRDIFVGLNGLATLTIDHNFELTSLPVGIFDDVLDTLSILSLVQSPIEARLSFSVANSRIAQGTMTTLGVRLNRALPTTVRVSYSATYGGSASTGHFSGQVGSVDIEAGQRSATFQIGANADAPIGSTLTISLGSLSLPYTTRGGHSGVSTTNSCFLSNCPVTNLVRLGGGPRARAITVAAPATGLVSLELSTTRLTENSGRSSILTLTLDGPVASGGVDIPYGISGEGVTAADLTPNSLSGVITIGEGKISGTAAITPANDSENEGSENFLITLVPPNGDYNGVTFAAGDDNTTAVLTVIEAICDRTAAVRNAIVGKISGVSDCNDVTREHLAAITGEINLRNRNLRTLKPGDFSGLTGLRTLSISGNPLTALPENLFSDLDSIEQLGLNNNQLEQLPENLFAGRSSLLRLYLHANRLTALPENIFRGLTSLNRLQLSNNLGLTGLPAGTFNGLDALRRLEIKNTPDLGPLAPGIFDDVLDTLSTFEIDAAVRSDMSFASSTSAPGPGAVTSFGVRLNKALPSTVRLSYTTAFGGGATALHFPGLNRNGVLEFARGTTATSIEVTVAADAPLQASITFTLPNRPSLVYPNDGNPAEQSVVKIVNRLVRVRPPNRHTLTVTGTATAIHSLRASPSAIPEDGGQTLFTLTLNGRAAGGGIAIPYSIVGAGITAGDLASHSTLSGVIAIAEGQVMGTAAVTAMANADDEGGDEILTLALNPPDMGTSYNGIAFGEGDANTTAAVTIAQGICGRTAAVRTAILVKVRENTSVASCRHVTERHLANARSTLQLHSKGLTELRLGDFDGLTGISPWLYLHDNNLRDLPVGLFKDLRSVKRMWAHDNQLTTLRSGLFDGMDSLKAFFIYKNQLSTVPVDLLEDVRDTLRAMSLSHNQLTELHVDLFQGLGNLDELLLLSGNQYTTLPETLFRDLANLQRLALIENEQLIELPANIFNGMVSLRRLGLSGPNKLSELPVGLFNGLDSLERLELADIPDLVLPPGIFDDVLDSLTELILDSDDMANQVKGTLSFNSPVSGIALGRTRVVEVQLDKALPSTVRVSYSATFGGGATALHFPGISEDGVLDLARGTTTATIEVSATAAATGTLSFALGELTLLYPTDDGEAESTGAQVISSLVRLGAVAEHTLSVVETATATGILLLETSSSSIGEGGGQSTLTVTLFLNGPAAEGGVNIPYDITGEGATTEDLIPSTLSGVIAIAAGDSVGTALITAESDGEDEDMESLTLTLRPRNEGYNEVAFSAGDANTSVVFSIIDGVCDRATAVHNAIVASISGVSDCGLVTRRQLRGVVGNATIANGALRVFNLNNRGITSLGPNDFAGMPGITNLYLNGNRLTTLPDNLFGDLVNLRVLQINNNPLATLSTSTFSGLGNLGNLFMNNNRLATLPEGLFAGMSRLTRLELNRNGLTALPGGIFNGLGQLSTLELDRNNLTALPEEIFRGLSLRFLYLNDNRLTALPEGIFAHSPILKRLELRNNGMTGLPRGIFRGLRLLETLWLLDNPLTDLPVGVFDPVQDTVTSMTLDSALMGALSFVSSVSGLAQGGTATIALQLDKPLPSDVRVGYSAGFRGSAGTRHFGNETGSVNIEAGQTSATFQVTAGADAPTGRPLILSLNTPSLRNPTSTVNCGRNASRCPVKSLVRIGQRNSHEFIVVATTPATGTLSLSASSVNLVEGGRKAILNIILNGVAGAGGIEIPYSISGPGIVAEDLISNSLSGVFTLAEGQVSTAITIAANNDNRAEGEETLVLRLREGTHGGVTVAAAMSMVTLTIARSTGTRPPTEIATGIVSLVASPARITEGGEPSTLTVTLNLNGYATDDLTIPWSIDGGGSISAGDFSPSTLSGVLAIAGGSSSGTLTIAALDDDFVEGDETPTLTLKPGIYEGVTVATSTLSFTIGDNDELVLEMDSTATQVVPEGNDIPIVLTLAPRSGRLSQPMTVTYRVQTSREDLQALRARLLAANEIGADVQKATPSDVLRYDPSGTERQVAFDTNYELSRPDPFDADATNDRVSFVLKSAPSGDDARPGRHFEVRIVEVTTNGGRTRGILDSDTDTLGVVIATAATAATATRVGTFQAPSPASIAEGGGPSSLSLRLNGTAAATLTIPYSIAGTGITAGDLVPGTLDGSVRIEQGESTGAITIAARDDDLIESTETLVVTLRMGIYGGVTVAANTTAGLTITDNDALRLTLANVEIEEIVEDDDLIVTLERAPQSGRLSQDIRVTYRLRASTETLTQLHSRLGAADEADATVERAVADDLRNYDAAGVEQAVEFDTDYVLDFEAGQANSGASFRLQAFQDGNDSESREHFQVHIVSVTTNDGGTTATLAVDSLDVVISTATESYAEREQLRRTGELEVASLAMSEAQAGMVLDLLGGRMKARPGGGTRAGGGDTRVGDGAKKPGGGAKRALQLTRRPEDFNDLLHALAFEWQAGGGGAVQAEKAGGMALWARVAQRSLSGSPTLDDGHVFEYDGSATGIGLGLEWQLSEQLLAGVSLTVTDGELDTESSARPGETGDGTATGVYEESLTLVTPYAAWWLNPRFKLWGALGLSVGGEVTDRRTLTGTGNRFDGMARSATADSSATLFAGGAEYRLSSGPGMTLDLNASLLSLSKTIDPLEYRYDANGQDEGVALDEIKTTLSQFKGNATLGWPMALAGGGQLRPYARVALVQDLGDTIGEDESGLELVGGIEYGSGRLSLSAEFGTELIREDREIQGLSAELKLSPTPGGQGLSLDLSTQDRRMQSRNGLGDIGGAVRASGASGDAALGREMGLEMGYGISLGGLGLGGTAGSGSLLTPYVASRQGREGDVRQGAGLKLKLPGMAFTLENNWQQQVGGRGSQGGVQSGDGDGSGKELRYGAELGLPGSPLRLTLKGTRSRTGGADTNTLGAEYRLLDDALRLKLETRLGTARTGRTNANNQGDQGNQEEKSSLTAELRF